MAREEDISALDKTLNSSSSPVQWQKPPIKPDPDRRGVQIRSSDSDLSMQPIPPSDLGRHKRNPSSGPLKLGELSLQDSNKKRNPDDPTPSSHRSNSPKHPRLSQRSETTPIRPGSALGISSQDQGIPFRRPSRTATSPQEGAAQVFGDLGVQTPLDTGTRDNNGSSMLSLGLSGSRDTRDSTATSEASKPSEELVNTSLIKQPDARPISEDQLEQEVRGIYAGLLIIEGKCVNVVSAQTLALQQAQQGTQSKSSPPYVDHWQALIALHRTLLHEHHDFFLASQHPSASPALRELASRYSMPARMWKHGIHSFLELLRRRLPDSLEFMIAFIYLAYQMMGLLYETVTAFTETWVECLGDLSRYRMAIEEENLKDREVWTSVARFWYSKASDFNPETGRLQHHLAILARNQPLKQLALYCQSLCAANQFPAGRESILTVFDPILQKEPQPNSRIPLMDFWFIKAHAILFNGQYSSEVFDNALENFLNQFEPHVGRITTKFRPLGSFIAISNISSLLKYGSSRTFAFWNIFARKPTPGVEEESAQGVISMHSKSRMRQEWRLTFETFTLALRRVGDRNVLPLVHVMLAFIWRLASVEYGADYLDEDVPITELASFLNSILRLEQSDSRIEEEEFISLKNPDRQILPEDFVMRGQIWAKDLFPKDWFKNASSDDDERSMEFESTGKLRAERVLWLGGRLASVGDRYPVNMKFLCAPNDIANILAAKALATFRQLFTDLLRQTEIRRSVTHCQRSVVLLRLTKTKKLVQMYA